ncbi:MAG: deoxyribonuclease [Thermovirga sp.]|jgi:deoxyribonuclease-4|nr:deoxyribonuclease [Thermovirga sp.]
MSIAGGLWKAIERGELLGCEAIQIFTKNQLQWYSSPLPQHIAERFLLVWSRSHIRKVVAHASYLINLAGDEGVRRKSIESLVQEVKRCDQLGIDELVLHPGSHRGKGVEEGLRLLSEALRDVLVRTEETRVRILLETMAGTGDGLGSTLEELEWVLNFMDRDPRLGVCVDTCHVFASGYELRTAFAYEKLVQKLEKMFGLERIGCWHLNDSKEGRGSKKDRHHHIGEGEIGEQVFARIVSDPRWEDVPCILETPKENGSDVRNLTLLRKMRGS